ncbi:hypothetical protein METHB2_270044 [Candidatus Methylobacter favarea]|uniref:Uncharacterized protein n=1 Tax=Candidatus Methylobacter favarea TaxID=2707345 RepID=A0A8S0WIS0_9GAMM|nr:hypothetical protein [Candidatus Methylobacter favarea]CAA9890714.1 hypothetical protein METHB2_270044 [Candidatus Methylobacter favarea]
MKGQPCPVCGALEHPWKNRLDLSNDHDTVQLSRVRDLEKRKTADIQAIAELNRNSSHGQE